MFNKKFDSLKMFRGIMYQEIHTNNEKIIQFALPKCCRNYILQGSYSNIGHPGKEEI